MSFNFFTSQQNFSSNLATSNQALLEKQDYTTNLKRETFTTRDSDSASNENRDKFSQFLNNEKKQAAEKARQDQAEKSRQNNDVDEKIDFSTRKTDEQSKTADASPNIPLSELDFAQIAALQAEIRTILEEQGSDETNFDILVHDAESGDAENEDLHSLLKLFSSLFTQESTESSDQDEFSLTQHEDLASALDHARSQLDPDLPQRIIVTNLTPDQIADLSEKAQAFFDGSISEEDLESLDALGAYLVVLTPLSERKVTESQSETDLSEDLAAISLGATEQSAVIPAEALQQSAPSQPRPSEQHITQSRYDSRYDAPSSDIRVQGDTSSADVDIKAEQPLKNDISGQNKAALSSGDKFLQQAGSAASAATPLTAAGGDFAASLSAQNVQHPVQSALTSVITQSQSASQPHPATQAVSANVRLRPRPTGPSSFFLLCVVLFRFNPLDLQKHALIR